MPIIRPFRGIRYNQTVVDITTVVAPPYDVISPEQQNQLYEKDPHNIVRLILGREEDRYSAAAKSFNEWQDERVLVREDRPAIYPLVQTFKTTTGAAIQRKGFIALCHLEEFERESYFLTRKRFRKQKKTVSNFLNRPIQILARSSASIPMRRKTSTAGSLHCIQRRLLWMSRLRMSGTSSG